ncbi:hypothetical protein I553_5905 [Mycobacterium xenopi 4042]|uniref:Uncharacterized protein n=1 Tax=Mycobacterium xenopi 4042 TaxID=1299334 RepID=X8BEX7_MYCXE|nr:hypothetical protein I553_5905 [Mycobacterium xenopi 4042]
MQERQPHEPLGQRMGRIQGAPSLASARIFVWRLWWCRC